MEHQRDRRKDEEKTPDALGNDRLQNEDMARAGKAGGTDIFVGDDELKREGHAEQDEPNEETEGIP